MTGQRFHLKIESGSKDAVLSEFSGLLDQQLAEHHFYMASFGRTPEGYRLLVDVSGPEPVITTS